MRNQKEINLYNQLTNYYKDDNETWEAVKIAIFFNLTPEQVKETY